MPPKAGTLSLDDLLKRRDVTPLQLGLDTIAEVIRRDLETHNRITNDLVSKLAVTTTDIRRRYGVSDTITFNKADEFTRAHTQKAVTGAVVEFPLHGFQAAIGWTAAFFREKTVADMAMTTQAVERGHVLNIRNQLQAAAFGSANYTFTDYRDTGIDVGVKRFLNADGAAIPDGPNGEAFDAATHTHYLFTNGLTNAGALALVNTVLEHHADARPVVYINVADEAAWRALADFKPLVDTRLSIAADTSTVVSARLDPYRATDRQIGIFGAAEVWTKPWGIANYALCLDLSPTTPKPLVRRVRPGSDGGLRTVGTNVLFPLQAEYMESEFGFGVWERTAGAVYYFAGGAVAYVDPAIVAAA